jgi:hypothetical protein
LTESLAGVLRSPGQPLERPVRTAMEHRFGHAFSDVRVHTDGEAARSAADAQALAYTSGRNIVFAQGQYSPGSEAGKRLLAHELAHVIQQRSSTGAAPQTYRLNEPDDCWEQEADRAASAVMSGQDAEVGHADGAAMPVQRKCGVAIGVPPGCTAEAAAFVPGMGPYKFVSQCDTFSTGEQARMVADVTALPAGTTFVVHGFASVDGDPVFNDNVSCARALEAKRVLIDSTASGGAGIPAGQITDVKRHGPRRGRRTRDDP